MSWAKSAFAPDQANSGRLSGLNTATSVLRAERIGPTGSASVEWNTAASRVTLPSTFSSYTTSAWFRPSCGRAEFEPEPSALSIFTTSAGRASFAGSSTGRPVSGYTGGGAVVVVTDDVVVVAGGAALFLPPHAVVMSRTAAASAKARRCCMRLQLPEGRDAVLEWWMGVEEPVEPREATLFPAGRHRLLDPEVRGRTRVRVDHRLIVAQLLERGDQARRVAGELDAGEVGERLAPAADGELHQLRDERREDQQQEPEDGEGHRERGDEDVVVLDVAQLVSDHAFELEAVHLVEQAGRHRDRRVLRVSAGGERVRGRVVDHVHPRLRKPGRDAQALDDVVQPCVLHRVGRPRPAQCERDRVGLPVRRERHDDRDQERDDDPDHAEAQQVAQPQRDEQREQDEPADQQRGATLVGGDLVVQR